MNPKVLLYGLFSLLCLVLVYVLAPGQFQLNGGAALFVLGMGATILETNSVGKKPDYSTALTFLRPDIFTLDTVMRRLDARRGVKRAKGQTVYWNEMDVLPYSDTKDGASTAGGAAASVAVVVDNGSYWKVSDICYHPSSGAKLLVTAVSGNTLTVYALQDSTTFGTVPAIADGDVLIRMTNAKEENSLASDPKSVAKVEVFNRTQIFDTVVAISDTRMATADWSMHAYDANNQQHLYDFRRIIENASVFGTRSNIPDPSNNNTRTTMQGIVNYLTTNDITYTAGSMTEALLIDWAAQLGTGNNGSRMRLCFTSLNFQKEVDKLLIASSTLQSTRDEKVLGVEATLLKTTFLDIAFIYNEGFNQYGKTNYALVVDPKNYRRRPLRPMKVKAVQENDRDGRSRQWLEELSQEVRNEATHGVIRDSATDSFN